MGILMDGWRRRREDGHIDGWIDGWMHGQTDGWMVGWMDGQQNLQQNKSFLPTKLSQMKHFSSTHLYYNLFKSWSNTGPPAHLIFPSFGRDTDCQTFH